MKSKKANWVQRNVVDEARLSELVEMYESLGFEVEIKDYVPEKSPDECHACMVECPEKYKIIYTRKREK